MARKQPPVSTPVESIRHENAKRKNIPTEELRDFVAEPTEPPAMLYPRDPSLDPQLVWKGKDEQDRQDLAVPVVPIYIQEKVHPQAIVEDLKARHTTSPAETQLDLFSDFNGIDTFEKKVDFYHHDAHWTNRLILGDSLMVMASLSEKEGLKGKVQTIYFDPPYGIKFGSNWQVSTRKRDVKDGIGADVTRQPEQVKAFRDTWTLGVHSYLAYLRDRIVVAHSLLAESGSVFVQIGDENEHRVRCLLDEVFGPENFVSLITFKKTSAATAEHLGGVVDYLMWYARDREHLKYREIFSSKELDGRGGEQYNRIELADGTRTRASIGASGRPYRIGDLTSARVREARTGYYEVEFEGRTYLPGQREWSTHKEGMQRLKYARRLEAVGNTLTYVRYLDDYPLFQLNNFWEDTVISGFADPKTYVVQTSTKVVERCVLMTTDPGDLVLDPTCGSGTTAYVAEQWGRRWITTDTSRVALALARTRLMTARYPFYLLADSPEGVKKEAQLTGQTPPAHKTADDVRKGFIYQRVPHVTLKSIANNPDIKEGMSRKEIDQAILRHAETETLYDKPYEDKKRLRVTGPFTVESLSPHRRISVREKQERVAGKDGWRERMIGPDQFGHTIIENLRKAGIQARDKKERLKFDTLEPFAGEWIHAAGEFTEQSGETKRVAVCIGPEHGTVGPELVKEAAKEAVKGVGFDLLYVCGFAFDPHVDEEAKRYGKLNVQVCRMNPDLSMGDELLKKTGAGNLFMVFGEPDIKITRAKDDQVTVEIRGVDVYDPTTGQIRSRSTDDIACWFIDTNYDGESFFVRHAYFTGADEPYEKLKRALRADIDEAAWSSLSSTTSQPFPPPKTGRIAVKVINHYGDEVLKVYSVN